MTFLQVTSAFCVTKQYLTGLTLSFSQFLLPSDQDIFSFQKQFTSYSVLQHLKKNQKNLQFKNFDERQQFLKMKNFVNLHFPNKNHFDIIFFQLSTTFS